MDLYRYIRDVKDFPKRGIVFKDITPLLREPRAFRTVVKHLCTYARRRRPHVLGAIESRGFIVGSAVADRLGIGFVPIRKQGKLPYKTVSQAYGLEYGKDHVEMHRDAIRKGERVLLLDDLLATGGTAEAAIKLVEKVGGQVVGVGFIIELAFLKGRARLTNHDVFAIMRYD